MKQRRAVARRLHGTPCATVILYGQHLEADMPAQTLVSLGMGSGIAAPLWHQGQATAVLQINCAPGHHVLTELHLDLATVLAHHASVALERTRLAEQSTLLQQRLARTERLEAMGLLASGLAHDFNNLLAPIVCYADAGLGCTSPDDEVQQDLLGIREAAQQATVLTKQLLTFGRGGAGQVEELDLNELLEAMGLLLTRLARGATVEISPSAKPARVEADPSQVQQTLLSLVVNAADAFEQGAGRLHLETHLVQVSAADTARHPELRQGTFVLLAASDNGEGIDRTIAERIFDPFFTTKPVGQGTGLGLATVYSILDRLGGSVSVFSEPGAGTVFELLIPASALDHPDASPYRPRDAVGDQTWTVLLLDQHDPTRQLHRRALAELGCRVVQARAYEELPPLEDGDVDLLLCTPEALGSPPLPPPLRGAAVILYQEQGRTASRGDTRRARTMVQPTTRLERPLSMHALTAAVARALAQV